MFQPIFPHLHSMGRNTPRSWCGERDYAEDGALSRRPVDVCLAPTDEDRQVEETLNP